MHKYTCVAIATHVHHVITAHMIMQSILYTKPLYIDVATVIYRSTTAT